MEKVAAVVVAAGRGERAGGGVPKQYRVLAGTPVVRLVLERLAPAVDLIVPVVHRDDVDVFSRAARGIEVLPPVLGGATRQQSVRAGLEALEAYGPDIVMVHDAARPFLSPALIARAVAAGRISQHGNAGAIPGLPISDTVKTVDSSGRVAATVDRTPLRTVQTPQVFGFKSLLAAHRKAADAGRSDFTDDAALAEWVGMQIDVFQGDPANVKLTTADDFVRAEMAMMSQLGDVRTGSGFDVHIFGDGDHVMLGGVRVPHTRGLTGHSDADVVLHALVDALLGALADGDIGVHFPPSDPQWRGASSDRFLAFAAERVRARGGVIAHLDATVVCEAPRVGPHRDAMRTRIAEVAGIAIDRVAIKATTSEKLGFTGRGEGMAAMATATVRLPFTETIR